jgi:hypothetical protein
MPVVAQKHQVVDQVLVSSFWQSLFELPSRVAVGLHVLQEQKKVDPSRAARFFQAPLARESVQELVKL